MKRIKDISMRLLPTVIVIAVTMLLSVALYRGTVKKESANCWNRLDVAMQDVANEICIRFSDNTMMLDLVADAPVFKRNLQDKEMIIKYLSSVQRNTIFERIDVLFPDNTLLLQTGKQISINERIGYKEMLVKGSHFSQRSVDPHTGNDSIYYATTIFQDGSPQAILIGMIDCDYLSQLFASEHYKGTAQLFLIDRADGNYILDNWHDSLENIYELGAGKTLDEYKDVDFADDIMRGAKGEVAYYSRTNGKATYMMYMPIEDFRYTLAFGVQEDVIFEDLNALKTMLFYIGIIEGIVLVLYIIWNTCILIVSVNNRERAQAAELERDKNEAKSRFLSSVSHDIRTPLNGIIGMLDVIKMRGEAPEGMKDSLRKIDASAKYLYTLVSDVLDMNEIESGKVILANDPIDLQAFVEDINVMIEPKAISHQVTFRYDLEGLTARYVLGSGVHLNRILLNLLTNAVKYNKPGGEILLGIENCGTDKSGKGIYVFTVSDSGIGMTEEFQKHMFTAFEQEHAGARTGQSGHGLGLSIVGRLVDKMGGTIVVDSKKDVGTTFVVTLPLTMDSERKDTTDTARDDTVSLEGVRVLLVEDNDLNMEIADAMLSGAGAKVKQAINGRKALEMFKESEPFAFDVILMDIMMPEMDGIEATKAIRALDKVDAKTIPIIAMTASTFSEDVLRCKRAGMNEHIGKPFDMASAIAKIAKCIKK